MLKPAFPSGFLRSCSTFHSLHSCFVSCLCHPGGKPAHAANPSASVGRVGFPSYCRHTPPSASGDGMTKHNFVKLVWNVNNWISQKTDRSRLLSALYFPIDRRLFWWCFDNAPYNILFSSSSVRASENTGCEDSWRIEESRASEEMCGGSSWN